MPEPDCYFNRLHTGPFTYCGWVLKYAGLKGNVTEPHQDWLCEPCIKSHSAFRFPEAKQQEKRKELEDARHDNLHSEEGHGRATEESRAFGTTPGTKQGSGKLLHFPSRDS